MVSNDAANRFLNRVQVVPVTRNVERLYPAEASITIGRARRKAMADQLTTASKELLRSKVGKLDPKDMAGVERVIKIQLGLVWCPANKFRLAAYCPRRR